MNKLINFVLEKLVLPVGDFITGSSFMKNLRYWRKVDFLSAKELKLIQEEKLLKLLNFAVDNTQFYEELLEFRSDNSIDWLKKFPILTKEKLRNEQEKLISKSNKKGLIKISSSGSSGISSTVYMSKKERSFLQAGNVHWWEWSGYKIGMPIIQTGISTKRGFLKSIKDIIFRTTYVSAFAHSEEQIIIVLKKAQNKKHFLVGYASSLNVMAEIAIKYNINISFSGVVSLGDKLFNHYRDNIEAAFSCCVKDTYGASEGFLISAEGNDNFKFQYISSHQVYIEILDDNGNEVPDGEMGNIVVTRLDGYTMPLIRYKLGDLGIMLPKQKYPKKRMFKQPLLQQIVGRETDIVKTNNGKILIVHSFTGIFEHIPEIYQFKVIQYAIDGITIEFVKNQDFKRDILNNIESQIHLMIGSINFKIDFREVKFIPTSNSGKPQIIESHLR